MSELYPLKRLREDQIEEASKVLARAFHADPLFVYLYPDPTERKSKMVTYGEFVILTGFFYLDVYITSNDIEGVAIWRAYNVKDQKIERLSKQINRRMRKIKREVFSDPLFSKEHVHRTAQLFPFHLLSYQV